MAVKPFSKDQLNFCKFSILVFEQFPKVLRQIFTTMWDSKVARRPGFIPWDDSPTVRNMYLTSEGGKTDIPTTKSIEEWDCTTMFEATIYAKTFGESDSKGSTLHDLYLKTIKPASSTFHPSVRSATGNQDETYALAIDQLRLLRNTLCHLPKPEIKTTDFEKYLQVVTDALIAVNIDTAFVASIGQLREDDFSTEKVTELYECRMKELHDSNMFYENMGLRFLPVDECAEKLKNVLLSLCPETDKIHTMTKNRSLGSKRNVGGSSKNNEKRIQLDWSRQQCQVISLTNVFVLNISIHANNDTVGKKMYTGYEYYTMTKMDCNENCHMKGEEQKLQLSDNINTNYHQHNFEDTIMNIFTPKVDLQWFRGDTGNHTHVQTLLEENSASKEQLLETNILIKEREGALKVETRKFENIFPPKSSTPLVANTEGNNSPHSLSPGLIISSDVKPNSSQSDVETNLTFPSQLQEQAVGTGAHLAEFNPLPQDQYLSNGNRNALNATNKSNFSSENVPFSIQVEEGSNAQHMSLIDEPSCLIAAQIYNAYKLLLLTISTSLLSSDIVNIREWAYGKFAIESNLSVTDVIFQLDRKGAINAYDLNHLRAFFVSIVRFDLVYLIDEFSGGDYDKFKKLISQNDRRSRNYSREQAGSEIQVASSGLHLPHNSNSLRAITVDQAVSNVGRLEPKTSAPQNDEIAMTGKHGRMTNVCSNLLNTSSTDGRYSTRGNSKTVPDGSVVNDTRGISSTRRNASNGQEMSAFPNTRIRAENVNEKKMSASRQHSSPLGQSNGPSQHRSHDYQRQSSHGKKQDKWLCNHYKRKCMVKFECCNKYWPCHRCHNEQSTCGRRKLKSRDTIMIKCVECGKEQKFGQFCVSCNIQFSTFYCGLCKHLTGNDDHPYHCEKCGICRIHGDRSYHCDVCGICLDVQLRGNHKCRPDSAHDECCICLEDAFTGCQILPCSHKVHKDCATRMIRNGVTRCPVCRESFAHKLERRPIRK